MATIRDSTGQPHAFDGTSHAGLLNVLAQAEAEGLKRFAETLIPRLGKIEVLTSRTGLVMLPMRDRAQGAAFHLGEVLVAEAHVRGGGQEGYGMRRVRDLEAAMALAELAVARGLPFDESAAFVDAEAARQRDDDGARLRDVEATRVDMVTF